MQFENSHEQDLNQATQTANLSGEWNFIYETVCKLNRLFYDRLQAKKCELYADQIQKTGIRGDEFSRLYDHCCMEYRQFPSCADLMGLSLSVVRQRKGTHKAAECPLCKSSGSVEYRKEQKTPYFKDSNFYLMGCQCANNGKIKGIISYDKQLLKEIDSDSNKGRLSYTYSDYINSLDMD